MITKVGFTLRFIIQTVEKIFWGMLNLTNSWDILDFNDIQFHKSNLVQSLQFVTWNFLGHIHLSGQYVEKNLVKQVKFYELPEWRYFSWIVDFVTNLSHDKGIFNTMLNHWPSILLDSLYWNRFESKLNKPIVLTPWN